MGTQTLIHCCQCGNQLGYLESIPAGNPSFMLPCPICGLTLVVDTVTGTVGTVQTSQEEGDVKP